jgi:flagellar biosynthesis GTPase FlhF
MSEKQPEKRPLSKAPSRQSSRQPSSSRSRSTSEQERASSEQSEQERASSSVAESDVNDQELQRIVRDESSEKLINEYVRRRFQSYLNNNVEDVDLWESIYYDFEYFTLRVW